MSQLIATLVGDVSCEIYVTNMDGLCQGFVLSCHVYMYEMLGKKLWMTPIYG